MSGFQFQAQQSKISEGDLIDNSYLEFYLQTHAWASINAGSQ